MSLSSFPRRFSPDLTTERFYPEGSHQRQSPEREEGLPREHRQHLPAGGARHGRQQRGARARDRDVRVAAHLHLLVRRHHHAPLLPLRLLQGEQLVEMQRLNSSPAFLRTLGELGSVRGSNLFAIRGF